MPLVPLLAAALAAAPATVTLDGRPTDPAALHSTVALFWRADCGPCLLELADLAALRKAAAPLAVQPVVLDVSPGDPGPVARMLDKVGLAPADTLRAPAAAEPLLVALGGAPARLPLAVAFDARGQACGRRTGLLGYDHLKAWAAACGARDAARR